MNWKEFFKPTKWKIILIFIIPFFLTYSRHFRMAMIGQESVWWQWTFLPFPIIGSFFYTTYSYLFGAIGMQVPFSQTNLYLCAISSYIIGLLINYIIICLIICLYKKFKK